MHKVVVERPRWNPGLGKKGQGGNLPDDLLPKAEGMRRPYKYRKGFTDLLGPLKRWLHSQVRRPWNAVYSEACAVIKPDSVIRAHIKTHLLEFVHRNTFMSGGEVCVIGWREATIPVRDYYLRRTPFYVHPETGILHAIKPGPRRGLRAPDVEPQPPAYFWHVKDRVALKQINGLWFFCDFQVIPRAGLFKAYDHIAESVVGRDGLVLPNLLCIRKRQLSRRELKHYQIKNVATLLKSECSLHLTTFGAMKTALTSQFGPDQQPV